MELTLFLLLIIQRLSLIFNLRIINFSYSSYITLKVKGSGKIKVYDNHTPDEIYINDINQTNISNIYNLNKEDKIKLVWNYNLESCYDMFYGCSNITEIDLSHFNSSRVTSVNSMFYRCSSLTSINFNNFDTSQVTSMSGTFYGCSSLSSIDLSSFITSNVEYMFYMFANCKSLTSLNLSNFDTSKLNDIESIFEGCSNLEYINFPNLNLDKINNIIYMLDGIPQNAALCIQNPEQWEFNSFHDCRIIDCSDNWQKNRKKIIINDNGNKECIVSCNNSTEYNFEFNGKCYKNCSYGYYIDKEDSDTKKCYCPYGCKSCSSESFPLGLCTSCNESFYPIYNDPLNQNNYYKCYQNPEGYYLDEKDSLYKPCYSSCETCKIGGDINAHNCSTCKDNLYYGLLQNNSFNCYEQCSYYYYNDENKCPSEYKNLILNKKCVKNCTQDNIYKNEFQNKCYDECPNDTILINYRCEKICSKEKPFKNIQTQECNSKCSINEIMNNLCILDYFGKDNQTAYYNANLMLKNILNNLKDNNYYYGIEIDENKSVIIEEDEVEFKIMIIREPNIKETYGECIINLYNYYNISINEPMFLLSIKIKNEQNPKILYEAFYLNYLLDLNICEDLLKKFETINCLNYSIESIINDECITCKENYYPKYNESIKNNTYKKCYKNPAGYYLDINESNYKECYSSCKYCDISGTNITHNCIECNQEYIYEINNMNYLNCYKSCPENSYKNGVCDIIPKCDKINQYLIPQKNICTDDCNKDIYKYLFNKVCHEHCPNGTKISETKPYICEKSCPKELPYENINSHECIEFCSVNDMFNKVCKLNYKDEELKEDLSSKIVEDILNGNLDELLKQVLIEDSDLTFEEEDSIHQITSLANQMNRMNLSSIDLKECENLLRREYKINDTEELIIYKIEHSVAGFNIPIIEYVLFTQDGSQRLNLTICNNITIQYNIPVTINEEDLYKYDPTSDFYNDECNKYSSDGNVDMTLYERKNQYNNNNMSLCESSCVYKGYNSTTSKAICDCNIKNDLDYSSNNTDNLLNKIDSGKGSSNIGVTQCFNVFENTEQIKSNSGFYLLLLILAIFIIIFILFCSKGKRALERKIDDVIYKKFKSNKNKNKIKNEKVIKSNKIINNKLSIKKKVQKKAKKKFFNKKEHNISNKKDVSSKIILSNSRKQINNLIKDSKTKKNAKLPKNGVGMGVLPTLMEPTFPDIPDKDNDYELNSLSYLDALKYDKRTGCDYYCSLIKNKQLFAFTFCSYNDYNSGIIKKFIFFLSFALHYTINALFFDDKNMHQIYEDNGEFNFSYQLPKILISAVCSTVILRIMLQVLVLTDKSILQVKHQISYDMATYMKYKVIKCMNIKFAIFFILNFILLILFWYYLTCFNAVYENTQIYLIENTAISFGFSLFYPFIINIIPVFLRNCALGDKKGGNECIYKASQVFQIL